MFGTELIAKFDIALRGFRSENNNSIGLPTKVGYVNKAIDHFNNFYSKIGDRTNLEQRWLAPLEKHDVDLKSIKDGNDFDTYELPADYLIIDPVRIEAQRDNCEKWFDLIPLRMAPSGVALNSPYYQGDFDFEQGYHDITSQGLLLYHTGGYKILKAKCNYIEKVPNIHAAGLVKKSDGYVYEDGDKKTKNVSLKLGDGGYIPILNFALIFSSGNAADLQLHSRKIANSNVLTDY
jgi:hypothetical protein